MAREELARFLRDRRERLRPADVGLPDGPRRRTPGLRREEVAALAAMSPEYYARLEQARGPRPSPRILDGIGGALRLDRAERGHLFRLAGVPQAAPARPVRTLRPYVAGLMHRIPDAGVVVTDATYDVIAWNPLAGALIEGLIGDLGDARGDGGVSDGGDGGGDGGDGGNGGGDGNGRGGRPNLARRYFLECGPRRDAGATAEFGSIAVSRLRAAAARYPEDPYLARLLAELREGSEEFGDIWDTHPVRTPGHRAKTIDHPEAGPLRVDCDVLVVPDDDQQVVFITADPATPTARAFRELARKAARSGDRGSDRVPDRPADRAPDRSRGRTRRRTAAGAGPAR
jgi:hypothetical protein